jgi:Na+-transporting methylmalonyl-CoA/oxaloacetate decarboxylase gamma subunit
MKSIAMFLSGLLLPALWFVWGCLYLFLPGGNLFPFVAPFANQTLVDLSKYEKLLISNARTVLIVGMIFVFVSIFIVAYTLVSFSNILAKESRLKRKQEEKQKQFEIEKRIRLEYELREREIKEILKQKNNAFKEYKNNEEENSEEIKSLI